MTQEEVLEYNKRCADFLGENMVNKNHVVEFTSPSYANGKFWISEKWLGIKDPDGNNLVAVKDMKFHSDWNWIMEVVETIEKVGYQIDLGSRLLPLYPTEKDHWCAIWDDAHKVKATEQFSDTSKKEAIVQAINQFLIWYNTQKP